MLWFGIRCGRDLGALRRRLGEFGVSGRGRGVSFGGRGGACLCELQCGFLLTDLTVEGGVGELASVEDLAGAFRVDSMVGDPLGNDGGDAED